MTATPFWLPLQERRERQRAKVGAIAFVEHFHRCPECMATQAREYASASAPFDAARDAALVRRDVNEALEIMVLEAIDV